MAGPTRRVSRGPQLPKGSGMHGVEPKHTCMHEGMRAHVCMFVQESRGKARPC